MYVKGLEDIRTIHLDKNITFGGGGALPVRFQYCSVNVENDHFRVHKYICIGICIC